MTTRALLSISLVNMTATCASSLGVRLHTASVQKSGNVALFFSVEDPEQRPLGGMAIDQFRIYEDEGFISPFESKQTILNPEIAVAHLSLLLLDLSGSITESGSTPELLEASTAFVERLLAGSRTDLAIYAFDGSADVTKVLGFSRNESAAKTAIGSLRGFKARDPSTNLHGAVVEALQILNTAVDKATQPIRFATLIVFTDGTDRAHRVSIYEMLDAIQGADVNVFAIGLGAEISPEQLEQLGNAGYVRAGDRITLAAAFTEIAEQIEASARKFYLLSYCSPARAGDHRLRVEAIHGNLKGSVTYAFNADGFGPNCDPSEKPAFSIERVLFQEGRESEVVSRPARPSAHVAR